ncbi:MAG: hypothetical protein KF886_24675 [Candidatus Hydrogenedentes bacterium]|nr:hypothetical protein [Candidatus Hydrogenedentota bacterium]
MRVLPHVLVVAALCCGSAPADTAAGADDEVLSFELPEPFYGGTVISYWSPKLEASVYQDRKPYVAPKGTRVVSRGKPVRSSAAPLVGELAEIVDGDKEFAKTSLVELPGGTQWVQIDLGATHDLYAILVWHFHAGARVYFDVIGQISDDPEFKTGVTTLFNNDFDNSSGLGQGEDNEYIDNSDGRLFDAKGAPARYVRFYSRGNSDGDFNHYVEIEVWGRELGEE